MALYAIGDLHLSFGTDKPMDVFGGGWLDYTEKIKEGFSKLKQDDVCILCGDISWGITLEQCLPDFMFLSELPGKKIILKGNHDYWWDTVTKMKSFFAQNSVENIDFLQNNCFFYEQTAICGTRGWILEDEKDTEYHNKIMAREAGRLRLSLSAAGEAGEKLCFFHYPPRFRDVVCHDIVNVMKDFGVKSCWYGHLHGLGHRQATRGMTDGVDYHLVSADYLGFMPRQVLP